MTNTKRQQRRARQHAAVRDEIKSTARQYMARDGAAALSLRAVASDLGLSSAAIYYYYPNRDALITDLIVDSFRAMGAALRAADDPDADIGIRLEQVMLSYRQWAMEYPSEYALLFGTPIPGYHAPADITAPEARAAHATILSLFAQAYAEGRLRADAIAPAPPSVQAYIHEWMQTTGDHIPLPALLASMHAWAIGHGLVGLELDHQLQPILGDTDAFYAYEIRSLLARWGIRHTETVRAD